MAAAGGCCKWPAATGSCKCPNIGGSVQTRSLQVDLLQVPIHLKFRVKFGIAVEFRVMVG